MRLLVWMQPRSRPAAVKTIATLGAAAALVTLVFLPTQPGERDMTLGEAAVVIGAAALVVAACWMTRSHRIAGLVAWALGPVLAVVAIVTMDLLTADATVAAQIFFFFPTLYGASQLPRAGAIVMTAASVVGEIVVAVSLLPLREAIVDIGYVSAALVTTAMLLIRSGERQAELVNELEQLAAIDPLTGLATRRVLDEAAQSAISGSASVEGTSLILIDVDDFKSINDSYGHPAGDEILVQLASVLVRSARHDDVVCRIGGDEMALLLPGCSAPSLQRRAEQIVHDVRARPFALPDGEQVTVSVSVGLAHAPTDAVDLRSLYVAADRTLYEAKRSGRNRVGIVAAGGSGPLPTQGAARSVEDEAGTGHPGGGETPDRAAPAPRRPAPWQGRHGELERLLRVALDSDGPHVAYQPIVELATGRLVAVEALLRLTDEAGNAIPAEQVIRAAEACGLIADLGRRVIQVAAAQVARWREDHDVLVPVAVNVSPSQLDLPTFHADVLDALRRSGVPPAALWIELTETALLAAGTGGVDQLRELCEAGVELAIDDFGTGYASLSLLHELPASTIKIDRSFIAGVPDDRRAAAIVAGVIAMAKDGDMTCVAEGIETEDQRRYLAERGVLGQGYLLGRPEDASAIGRLVAGGRSAAPHLSAT